MSRLARPTSPLVAALVLAAFSAAFFAPLLRGATFSTVPGHQAAMWPWAATPTGYPDAPQSDQAALSRPWSVLTATALRRGELPWWNPHSFGGQPFFANGTSGVLYPPRLVTSLLLGPERGHDALCVLHVFAAGMFAWCLLRELGCRAGALLGAVSWGFSGFHLAWLQLEVMAPIGAFLPACLWFVVRAARRRSWPSTVGAAATGAVLLTSGHLPQAGAALLVAIAWSAALALRAVRAGGSRVELLRPLAVALGAVSLAGIVLVPTAHVLLSLDREAVGWEARDAMRVPAWLILRGVFLPPPGPATATTLHVMPFVGTLTGALAVFGLTRSAPGATFARCLAATVTLVVTGTVVLRLVLAVAPPLSVLAPLGRLLNLVALSTCVLGAIGLDAALDGLRRRPRARALARVVVGAVVTLTALQLIAHGRAVNPPFAQVRPDHFFPVTPLIAAIDTSTTPASRVLPLSRGLSEGWQRPVLFGATAVQFEVPSVGGYDSVVPDRAETLWRVIAGEDPRAVVEHRTRRSWAACFRVDQARLDLLPRLGVDLVAAAPDIEGDVAFGAATRGLTLDLLHAGADGRLYRVRGARPGPFVVHGELVVDDTGDALQVLLDPTAPWRERLVVERADLPSAPASPAPARPAGASSARLSRPGPERIDLDVDAAAAGWVVVPETWDAGWTAVVDGAPAPVVRSHVNFTAVRVPAGRSTVVLTYRPVGLGLGAALSGLGLAGALALLLRRRPAVR